MNTENLERIRSIAEHYWKSFNNDPDYDPKADCLNTAKRLGNFLKKEGFSVLLVKGTFELDNPDPENYSDWDVNDFDSEEEMETEMYHALHYWNEIDEIIIDITAYQFQDEVDEALEFIVVGTYKDYCRYTPQDRKKL